MKGTLPKLDDPQFTVVYDGTCAVCKQLAKMLGDLDPEGRLEVVASPANGVMPRFPWIPASAYSEALQLIGPNGRTWAGAAAIEELLGILPRGAWFAWVFSIPFARPLADRVYRWFARNRYRMGCSAHCQAQRNQLP